jgi:hypothetical protein
MSTRLQPMVTRKGYAFGASQLRLGNLVYIVMLILAFGGLTVGTVAIADVVRSIVRPL